MKKIKNSIGSFFKAIGSFFHEFGTAVVKGDFFVKLSLLWVGAGYARRKQFIKAILMTVLEAIVLIYSIAFAPQYVSKFLTLGTKTSESLGFNMVTMQVEYSEGDNSLMILLISLITFVFWIVAAIAWLRNVVNVYHLQQRAEEGKHINTFAEDVRELFDHKFHVALLSLPVIGVIVLTLFPLLFMIFVAFTNYDQNHMPPAALFEWVGIDNFVKLFGGGGMTVTFGYTFVRILIWTLVWAFFATLTTYIGCILLALLINNRKTKASKLWRLFFIITIAVPQFVSLLLVRNFFADNGIANTFCSWSGLTGFLNDIGVLSGNYIPFLTQPGWAHVMIIIINIWVGVPYQMLIATGVLMNIPEDLKESARIDGATSSQIFRKITMPYMLFVTGPTLITDFVKNINNFNVIYLLTAGMYVTTNQAMANSYGKETDLLVTWLFGLTQDKYNYKMASTIGIVVFLICAVFTLVAFNRMIKGDREETFN